MIVDHFTSVSTRIGHLLILAICFSLTACTTAQNPHDPYEGYNRSMSQFNNTVDSAILKPIAKGYNAVLPGPARKGFSNFFNNIDEIPTLVNNLLQADLGYAFTSFWRISLNSTIGILGLVDAATALGLEKRYNDFGLTLARWGITDTPYFVLPLFGPSTVADGLAAPIEFSYFSVWRHIDNIRLRNGLLIWKFIDTRASLLAFERTRLVAALDSYIFERDAYLQHRKYLLNILKGEKTEDTFVPGSKNNEFLDDSEYFFEEKS